MDVFTKDLTGKALLLVEDESIVAAAQTALLQAAGYRVIHAPTGEQALELACETREQIDLVLMDVDLGEGIDGGETAARILETRSVPIIFVSAHTEHDVVDRTGRVTSYGYVVKNSGGEVLLASIRMAFRLFQASEELRMTNAALHASRTELVAGREAARRSEEHLSTTLDSIGDAVIATDTEMRVIRMNQVAERLTGWTFATAAGRRLDEVFALVDTEGSPAAPDPARQALEERRPVEMGESVALRSRDGTVCRISDSASPIRSTDGTVHGVVLVFRDVTEAHTRQRKLAEHELFLSSILESVQDGISVSDRDLRILHVNRVMRDWYPDEDLFVGKHCYRVFRGRNTSCPDCPTLRAMESGRVERAIVRRDDDSPIGWIEIFSYPIRDPADGTVTGVVEFVRDITARVETEEALHRSVRENRTLMQELQHRVKNNLNVISSLLGLETPRIADQSARQVLEDAQLRVQSMAMIYDQLQQSDRVGEVRLDGYLEALVSSILEAYEIVHRPVTMAKRLEEVIVNTKIAVATGLITNELLTNSLKYAFPEASSGEIRVELTQSGRSATLTVSDDGIGLPPGLDISDVETTGLMLVRELAGQIDGSLSVARDNGTRISVAFGL